MTLSFSVTGVPQPKGSMKALGHRLTSDNPRLRGWQRAVAFSALVAMRQAQPAYRRLDEGPVTLRVAFLLARPQKLQAKHQPPHTTRPDLDKLTRAIGDALTGVAWADDGQVDRILVRKVYAPPGAHPRADIQVEPTESSEDFALALASAAQLLEYCAMRDRRTRHEQLPNWLHGHAATVESYLRGLAR